MSLIVTALLLCSPSDATLEETSLMQGLVARHNALSSDSSAKASRQDATATLMETATKMMKNGATPDVITFIETTITEVNSEVLGRITDEHYRDQQLVNDMHGRFQTTIDTLLAAHEASEQMFEDRVE